MEFKGREFFTQTVNFFCVNLKLPKKKIAI